MMQLFYKACMSVFFYMVRWFALDTLLAVASVQLYLSMQSGHFLIKECIGVCCLVSMAYMCDRYRDVGIHTSRGSKCEAGKAFHQGLFDRHNVFRCRFLGICGSVIGLGGVSLVCLHGVTHGVKVVFIMCAAVYVGHIFALRWDGYGAIKDGVVSLVFTLGVFSVFMEALSVMYAVLIGVYVYFNLISHVLIERRLGIGYGYYGFLLLGGIVVFLAYVVLGSVGACVFFTGIVAHIWVVVKHPYYWYEWGELAFAWPFIVLSFILS
jgi:hypothetical protein